MHYLDVHILVINDESGSVQELDPTLLHAGLGSNLEQRAFFD